eukprot:gene427-877_t
MLGRALLLRLNIPLVAPAAEEEEEDFDACLNELFPETSESFQALRIGLDELIEEIGSEATHKLIQGLPRLCHDLDEANDITKHLREDKDMLKFGLEFIWGASTTADSDLMVVSVTDDAGAVKYYWSLQKFDDRLNLMRESYDEFHNCGKWEPEDCMDPWHDATPAQLENLLHEVNTEAHKDAAETLNYVNSVIGKSQETILASMDGNNDTSAPLAAAAASIGYASKP